MRKLTASILLTICAIAAAQTSAFKRTILAKEEISLAGREAVVVRVEIPATGSVGRHTHYGEEAGFIESGEVEMLIDGAAPRRIKAGEAFIIPAGKVHDARNVGQSTARVIVTYVVEKGKPLAEPAK